MRGRDVILIILVIATVGALSSAAYWVGAFDADGRSAGIGVGASAILSGAGPDGAVQAGGETTAEQDAARTGAPPSPGAAPAARVGERALAADNRLATQDPSRGVAAGSGAPGAVEVAAGAARDGLAPNGVASNRAAPDLAAPADGADAPPGADSPDPAIIELDTNRPESAVEIGAVQGGGLEGGGLGAPSPAAEGVAPPPAGGAGGPALEALRQNASRDALGRAARDSGGPAFNEPASPELGGAAEDAAHRPSFDVVRIAPDGSAVIAGRAAPGAMVALTVDGAVTDEVQADRRGEFVALLAPPAQGELTRHLGLESRLPDGANLTTLEPVIVTTPDSPGEAPLAIRPTPAGVELMQPPPLVDQDAVTIDTVSYDDVGDVEIGGRGVPGQVARVYLDNSLSAEARIGPDGGWRARLVREIAPAVYTLRVDQMTMEGVVTGRAETPFERERVENILLRRDSVVVQPGNNLWRIADYVYGDGTRYQVIYRENRKQIRDPDLIYPGQILALPYDQAAN